jgi:hypothetical protein
MQAIVARSDFLKTPGDTPDGGGAKNVPQWDIPNV